MKYKLFCKQNGRRRSRFQRYQFHTTIIILILVVTCSVLSIYHVNTVEEYETQIKLLNEVHAEEIAELSSGYVSQQMSLTESHSDEISSVTKTYEDRIDELTAEINTLTEKANVEYAIGADEFRILQKYAYVLEAAPENSGLTVDDILYLDNLCKENNLNPHLMMCIYKKESNFTVVIDNFGGSGARGLGQVMELSGRDYYERILNLGTYDHTYAYDAQTNMLLTVTMVSDNLPKLGLEGTIAMYSGDSSGSYYQDLLGIAANYGVNITNTSYQ